MTTTAPAKPKDKTPNTNNAPTPDKAPAKSPAPKLVKITVGRLDKIDIKLFTAAADVTTAIDGLKELVAGKHNSKSPIVDDLRSMSIGLAEVLNQLRASHESLHQVRETVADLL